MNKQGYNYDRQRAAIIRDTRLAFAPGIAPRAIALLSDAAFQLERLTGENLEVYARTFAALARAEVERANKLAA